MVLPELCKDFACDTCCVVNRCQSFKGAYRAIELKPSRRCFTLDQLLEECKPGIDAAFGEIVRKRLNAKVMIGIKVLFQKIGLDGMVQQEDHNYMSVHAQVVKHSKDAVDKAMQHAQADLESKIEAYTNKGSNWIVAAIEHLSLAFASFT